MAFPTRSSTPLTATSYNRHIANLTKDIKRAPGKKDIRFNTACQQVVSHLALTSKFDGTTADQITNLFTHFLKEVAVAYQASNTASNRKNSCFLFSVSRNIAWNNQARVISAFGTVFDLARKTQPQMWDRYDCDSLPVDDQGGDFSNASLFMISLFRHTPSPTVQREVFTSSSSSTLTRDGDATDASSGHSQSALTLLALPAPSSPSTDNLTRGNDETGASSHHLQSALPLLELPATSSLTSAATNTNAPLDLTEDLKDEVEQPIPGTNGEDDLNEPDFVVVDDSSNDDDEFEEVLPEQFTLPSLPLDKLLLELALKDDDSEDES